MENQPPEFGEIIESYLRRVATIERKGSPVNGGERENHDSHRWELVKHETESGQNCGRNGENRR